MLKIFSILFLWGGIKDEAKFHLVNWDNVGFPISSGGLGVRKLKIKGAYGVGLWKNIRNGCGKRC